MRLPHLFGAALLFVPLIAASGTEAVAPARQELPPRGPAQSGRVEPDLDRPLAWLVAAQSSDGSWGEEARSKNPDVATTSIAGIALLRVAKARALSAARTFLEPDDVKAVAVPVLAHRLILAPEARSTGLTGEQIVQETLEKTPVPV